MTVTFFGHKNTPFDVYTQLLETVTHLIENEGAELFFIGNQGNFDYMARKILKMLSKEYPHIHYSVVLAYMPTQKNDCCEDYSDTTFPDVLDNVSPRYAIEKRNRYMVKIADTVVAYVKHPSGGAYKFCSIAKRKGKKVINLAEKQDAHNLSN